MPLITHIAAGKYKFVMSGRNAKIATLWRLCIQIRGNALAIICHNGSLMLPDCLWNCPT